MGKIIGENKGLLVLTFLFSAVVVGGSTVLFFRHPSDSRLELRNARGDKRVEVGVFPSCWLRRTTGIYCPGCGATRAYHYLLRGEIRKSLRYHPLVLPLYPVLLFLFIRFFYEAWTKREWKIAGFNFWSYAALALILVFWILRNIPGPSFEILRPPH